MSLSKRRHLNVTIYISAMSANWEVVPLSTTAHAVFPRSRGNGAASRGIKPALLFKSGCIMLCFWHCHTGPPFQILMYHALLLALPYRPCFWHYDTGPDYCRTIQAPIHAGPASRRITPALLLDVPVPVPAGRPCFVDELPTAVRNKNLYIGGKT